MFDTRCFRFNNTAITSRGIQFRLLHANSPPLLYYTQHKTITSKMSQTVRDSNCIMVFTTQNMLLIVLIRLKRMLHVYQTLKSLSHSVLWLKANVRQDIYLLYVTESIKNFFFDLLRSENLNRFKTKGVTG